MVRKLVSFALAVTSAAAVLLQVEASPAHADLRGDACRQLPANTAASAAAITQATNALQTATANLGARRSELDAAVVTWVNAVADLLVAIDSGVQSSINRAAGVVEVTQAAAGARASLWGNAQLAQWSAQHALDLNRILHQMNLAAASRLGCGAVTTTSSTTSTTTTTVAST